MRASYEARLMHGLLGQVFSYKDLLSACPACACQKEEAEREKETRAENQQPQPSPETPSNAALPSMPQTFPFPPSGSTRLPGFLLPPLDAQGPSPLPTNSLLSPFLPGPSS